MFRPLAPVCVGPQLGRAGAPSTPHRRSDAKGGTIAAMTMVARRRMIALTAAYAVALQAILSSFALLAMSGRSTQEICAPVANGALPGSLPSGPDCMACPVPCGGAGLAGVESNDRCVMVRPPLSSSVALRVAPVPPRAVQRLLPPTRAPPAA
jgi:hypothetical protein